MLYSEASFNFFLLTFYLKYFPGNLFENSVYFACSDLMAYLLAGLFFNFASIKTGIRFGATLACAGGLMYLFMSKNISMIPYMLSLARVGQSMVFNITVISINRIFPTAYVATAYGVVNFCSHLWACLAPFVAEIPYPFPFIAFVAMIGIAIFTSFVIKEVDPQYQLSKEESRTPAKPKKRRQKDVEWVTTSDEDL